MSVTFVLPAAGGRPRLSSSARPRVPLAVVRRAAVLAVWAVLVQLAGCAGWPARAPAPELPVAPAAVGWQQPVPAGPAVAVPRWWAVLGDATLDRLVDDALAAAPDLRTAALRLREARARREATAASASPDLSATGRAARSRSSGAAGAGRSSSLFDLGFDASWEADVFGRLAAATEGAEADVAATAAGVEDLRLSLAAEVARLYTTLRSVQQREAIAAQALQRQADTLQIARWRAQAGLAAPADVLLADTSLQQTLAQQAQLAASQAAARLQLELLLGRAPGGLTAALASPSVAPALTLSAAPAPASAPANAPASAPASAPATAAAAAPRLPVLPAGGAVAQPADVLRQRPDVRQAEAQWRAEAARTRQAEAAQFPRLTLSGSLGLQALSLGTLGQGGYGSLAAGLAAPLVDGGVLRAQLAAQVAVRERAARAYEQAMLTALSEVEQALAALDASRRQALALQQAVAAARQTAELARVRWRAGLVDARTVIEAERSVLTLEDSLASAQASALTGWIQWHKALGAGAWAAGDAATTPAHTAAAAAATATTTSSSSSAPAAATPRRPVPGSAS